MSVVKIDVEIIKKGEGEAFNKYLSSIVREQQSYRHRYYKQTTDHAESMGVHIEGFKPTKLLEEKRPNEPEEVRKYRLKTWKNVTQSQSEKITNTVARIFNPKLYKLKFPEKPSIIPEGEDLGRYLTEEYGVYKSLWVFVRETLLKMTFSDPNSVCVVFPENPLAENNEFYRPLPIIYRSETVVDFVDDLYYTIYIHNKKTNSGKIMVVTDQSVRVYNVKGTTITSAVDYDHGLGVVPAFRLGGKVMGSLNPYYFHSFVSGIQPHWDKAITMISDADGSIVNHLFPERWEWQSSCNKCNGKGKLDVNKYEVGEGENEAHWVDCKTCLGTGYITNKSPYGVIGIKRDALNPDLPTPTPPAAYIDKDIEPLRELRNIIKEEILEGFSSINMEILHKVGENQSGVAKTIDRQDLDSFLMRVANHVFDCQIKPIIEFTARWRMSNLLSEFQLEEYIREVSVSKPKEFNIVSMNALINELKEATTANVSANYIKSIETELINNKFSNNETERKLNLATVRLKPFPNLSTDQLLSARAANAITLKDFIRNQNIDDLVLLAVGEDDNFVNLSFKEQLDKIYEIIERDYMNNTTSLVPVSDE